MATIEQLEKKLDKRIEALEQIHNPSPAIVVVSEAEFSEMSEVEKNSCDVIIIDNIPAPSNLD